MAFDIRYTAEVGAAFRALALRLQRTGSDLREEGRPLPAPGPLWKEKTAHQPPWTAAPTSPVRPGHLSNGRPGCLLWRPLCAVSFIPWSQAVTSSSAPWTQGGLGRGATDPRWPLLHWVRPDLEARVDWLVLRVVGCRASSLGLRSPSSPTGLGPAAAEQRAGKEPAPLSPPRLQGSLAHPLPPGLSSLNHLPGRGGVMSAVCCTHCTQ